MRAAMLAAALAVLTVALLFAAEIAISAIDPANIAARVACGAVVLALSCAALHWMESKF